MSWLDQHEVKMKWSEATTLKFLFQNIGTGSGCPMTRFSNLVSLKSQKSHLGAPDYLMGYIIMAELHHWEVMDLFSVLSKKGGSTLVNM